MVFIMFCRCRLIRAANRFFSYSPAVELVETPALPGTRIASSAHAAAGAERSLLAPHPFPFLSASVLYACPLFGSGPLVSDLLLSVHDGSANAVG